MAHTSVYEVRDKGPNFNQWLIGSHSDWLKLRVLLLLDLYTGCVKPFSRISGKLRTLSGESAWNDVAMYSRTDQIYHDLDDDLDNLVPKLP